MVGGYISFTGFEGKARYGMTALRDVLPVELPEVDDRIELPAGGTVSIAAGTPIASFGDPPTLLGYNRSRAKSGADVWATIDDDPLIAVASRGAGHCGVFTSDLAPHWASPAFVEWENYGALWTTLIAHLFDGPSAGA